MPAQRIEADSVCRKACDLEAGHRQLASWRASEVRPAACFRSRHVVPVRAPLEGRGSGVWLLVLWHCWHQVEGFEGSRPWPLQFGFRVCCK